MTTAFGAKPIDDLFEPAREAGWIDPKYVTRAMAAVISERHRQIDMEGWTPEHDDSHTREEMASAAACYACPPALRNAPFSDGDNILDRLWPWSGEWWKPKDRRSNLVRAGALIIAEIERLDRLSERTPS